jgi:NADH-quinone oxidoreductase subunit L
MNWLILLPPLIAAVVITMALQPFPRLASYLSVAACLVSAVGSFLLLLAPESTALMGWEWMAFPDAGLVVSIGAMDDALARMMLMAVSGVGLLIHFFSLGYMGADPGRARYFAKLSFFMFSMLGIVLADNLVMMFIFWELVGLSSYFLIGFWFQRPAAAEASKKAFIVNRIGDFGFLLGILGAWAIWGSIGFLELENAVSSNHTLIQTTPLMFTLVGVGLFMGCVGKSAQFPLHVWLPDAMEGPTPVSALIHAATMVAAGVYMICRVFFILELSAVVMNLIAWIGMGTALFAAVIAVRQDDIKRILAYSTLSQLGYMVSAVGLAGGLDHAVEGTSAAMYHLTTHAFFKALLFLGAGSIIYALHHEQNIWKMGGLLKRMPVTSWTFLIATAALMGCPPLSGFFSKEAILMVAWHSQPVLCIAGLATAGLTAFYMTRLVVVVFWGPEKGEEAAAAKESPAVMIVPLVLLAFLSVTGGFLGIDAYYAGGKIEHHAGALMIAASLFVLIAGLGAGIYFYRGRRSDPLDIEPLTIVRNKFYSDEIYEWGLVRLQDGVAAVSSWIDRWLIGTVLVRGTAATGVFLGQVLRLFQSGVLHTYAWLFLIGILFLCLVIGVLN